MRTPGFWYQRPGLRSTLLAPFGWVYGAVTRSRLRYGTETKVPAPVICVGNLVAGGSGKTPVAIALARRAAERGMAATFLTRGYGGRLSGPVRVDPRKHDAGDVGDEPLLLAAYGPVIVSRDRLAGAHAAITDGAGLIIMDDGFQNPALSKDLSLLVIDGASGFGNGRLIPAGPLRERPVDGLARADAVILMGQDRAAIRNRLSLPVLHARLEPRKEAMRLKGQIIVAFAGIGHPEKFFMMLEQLGADVISRFAFPDHHRYTPDDINRLLEMSSAAEASLVTTTKDFARLPIDMRPLVEIVEVDVVWSDDAAIDHLLNRVLPLT